MIPQKRSDTGCTAPRVRRGRETDATRTDGAASHEETLPPQRRLEADQNRAKTGPLSRQLGAAPLARGSQPAVRAERRKEKGDGWLEGRRVGG